MLHYIQKLLRRFYCESRGAIVIIASISIPVLVTLASIGIEVARVTYAESKLAYAADAAAIAGARYDINDARINAQNFFEANFPPGFLGISVTPEIFIGEDNRSVTVTASSSIPTVIGRFVGISTLPVNASSTVIREFGGLELAMALDVTGSMAWFGKINSLRTAAKNLVDIIYEGQESRPNTGIALVPYVTNVNIGPQHADWLSNPGALANFPARTPWKGCIRVQGNPFDEFADETEDPPTVQKWPVYFTESTLTNPFDGRRRDNDWTVINGRSVIVNPLPTGPGWRSRVAVGPNRSCGPEIMPLTNSRTALKNEIDTYAANPGGGTNGHLGLVWSWRSISELWSGLWDGREIKPYDAANNRKAIIVMTDGVNQWANYPLPPSGGDPNAYGTAPNDRFIPGKAGAASRNAIRQKINEKFDRVCTAAKQRGIEMYTITFMVNDQPTRDLFRSCATNENFYFNATTGAELVEFFGVIANQLKTIRIVK